MITKKDITIAIFVGIASGLIWTGILLRLKALAFLGGYVWALVVIAPIVFVIGLYVGKLLSGWKPFFYSFARFVIIGFLNAGVDFGIFNLLIFITGIEKGDAIALFKTAAFITAFINSYFWNKYWTFQAGATEKTGSEFVKYTIITIIGALINVGTTYSVINFIKPVGGLTQLSWDNVAAVLATVLNLTWNFVGYKVIVFKNPINS